MKIEKRAKKDTHEVLNHLKPLNFNLKDNSEEELDRIIKGVKPASQGCGLCRIVLGKG